MGTRLSAKLEDTGGEIIKRPLVAEENHLAVDLATQLQTVSDLAHFGFADFFAAKATNVNSEIYKVLKRHFPPLNICWMAY